MAAKDDKERTGPADVVRALEPDNPPNVEFDPTNELLDNDDLPNVEDVAALKAQGMVLLPSGRLAHESELREDEDNVIPPPQSANLERRLALRKLAEAQGLSVGTGLENAAEDDYRRALESEVKGWSAYTDKQPGREELSARAQRRVQGAKEALKALGKTDSKRGAQVDESGTTAATREDAAKARQAAGQTRTATPAGRTPQAGRKTTAAE